MKKILYYSILVAVVCFTSSCAVSSGSLNTNPVYSLEKPMVTNGRLETDLEMIGEVSATVVVPGNYFKIKGNYVIDENYLFRNFKEKAAFEKLKAAVLYEVIKDYGCDIILTPIYTMSSYSMPANSGSYAYESNVCSFTVRGFGAKVKGVRQIKTQ